MRWNIITIFPQLISNFCSESLLGKAQAAKLTTITTTNPRDFAAPPHFKVDDTPYGGGAGMVMSAPPLLAAIAEAKRAVGSPEQPSSARVILLSPAGAPFTQHTARRLAQDCQEIILVCGRYEGIDQRVIDNAVDEEISIGDFVLMGGEAAALCVIEACTRLLPGVLGNDASPTEESFDQSGLLEAPCYTKPSSLPASLEGVRSVKNMSRGVPAELLSGNHKLISEWRAKQRVLRTEARRPELLKKP